MAKVKVKYNIPVNCWPDYQCRVIRNIYPTIKWENKVHEVPVGFKTFARIPAYEELAFYHPKSISRQEKQNNFYNTL